MTKRTIYTKYKEKMNRLIKASDMGHFTFFDDSSFSEFSQYFKKTIKKETCFHLYRYSPVYRYNSKNEKELYTDFKTLYCATNGSQNDIFEGLPYGFYDIYSVEDCIQSLEKIAFVKSFSETPYDGLMWAHYADKYSGICIEYDIRILKDIPNIFPVQYSKEKTMFGDIEGLNEHVKGAATYDATRDAMGMFLQKADYWKYEREWRFCEMNKDPTCNHRIIPFQCVSAIYLGPKIKSDDKELVVKGIREHYDNTKQQIKLMMVKLKNNEYQLDSEELLI